MMFIRKWHHVLVPQGPFGALDTVTLQYEEGWRSLQVGRLTVYRPNKNVIRDDHRTVKESIEWSLVIVFMDDTEVVVEIKIK